MSSYIGQPIQPKEFSRLLSGGGRFVGDLSLPSMLEAAVMRSPHAHGRIVKIDTAKALQVPGVIAVYTADDIGNLPGFPTTFVPRPELSHAFQRPLARHKVRYVGEPLAFVVAVDRYIAEDAIELIDVEIDPLDAIVDARLASGKSVPLMHDAISDNVAYRLRDQKGDVDSVLRNAPYRLRRSFATHRHTGVPMETRGLLASHDQATGLLTVWGPTKVIHRTRAILATLLKIPEERIRCVEPDVGGGFGFRGEFFPEDFLVAWAALKLNAPVRWIEDRQEHFLATNHSRQQWHDLEIGFDDEGRILAMRDTILMDMGAYIRPNGLVAPTHTVASLPGPYRIPIFDIQFACVLTNKTPHGSYRGPGMFEACFVRERAIDMIAKQLAMDPAVLRQLNMVSPKEMPYAVGTHEYDHEVVFDGGDYRATLNLALQELGYAEARARQQRERANERYLGIGFASFVEPSGLGVAETARIALQTSGKVLLYTGTASLGQGVDTALAQICADTFGADLDDIEVKRGDTAIIPEGGGAWGSRTTVLGGSAVFEASLQLRDKVLSLAALRLQASKDTLKLERGVVSAEGQPHDTLSLRDIVELPQSALADLDISYTFRQPKITYAFGSAAALVEVDPRTGAIAVHKYVIVSDVGRVINPAIVEGQMIGGMAQGLGGTLLEELIHDEQGQLLTTTFADYLLPTASEMPREVVVRIREDSPSPSNPIGVKGAGEGGIVPTGAVLANAIADALAPFGVDVTSLPLSHDRIRTLVREGAKQ